MKKILYTLLVGLAIIACNKEEMNPASASSINVVEAPAETDNLTLIQLILNNAESYPRSKRGNASNTNKGSDYVACYLFEEGDFKYMTLLDESNDDLCLGDREHSLVYLSTSEDGLIIEDSDEVEIATIAGDWGFLFEDSFNILVKINSDEEEVANTTFTDANVATF